MRILFSILTTAFFSFVTHSCGKSYKIDGVVDIYGYEGKSLTIVTYSDGNYNIVDSGVVQHGIFHMRGTTDRIRYAMLCNDGDPIIPLYLEKGRITISLLPTQLEVRGTRQNNLLYDFLDKKSVIDNRYDDVLQKKLSLMQSGHYNNEALAILEDSLKLIVSEAEELIYKFITYNYKETVAVGIFSMMCYPYYECDSCEITPLIKKILDNAPDDFLNAPHIAEYIKTVGYIPKS